MAGILSKAAHQWRTAAPSGVAPAQDSFPIPASVCTRQGQQRILRELYKCCFQVLREVKNSANFKDLLLLNHQSDVVFVHCPSHSIKTGSKIKFGG